MVPLASWLVSLYLPQRAVHSLVKREMRMLQLMKLTCVVMALIFSGCGLLNQKQALPNDVDVALMSIARETHERLRLVSKKPIEASLPQQDVKPSDLPASFSRLIYLDWYGDVGPAVRAIASNLGWRYKNSLGVDVPPVLVVITGEQTIADALISIGRQSGGRVDIAVDEELQQIEVISK